MTEPEMTPRAVWFYADCSHPWYVKARDWLRFRRHPASHAIYYSALYAATRDLLLTSAVDLDADTVRILFTSDGKFTLD